MEKTTDKGEQMTPPKGYKHTELGVLPEDWEVVRLGEVGEFLKGSGISKDDIADEGIPCIRYGELYTTYGEKIEEVFSHTDKPQEELVISKTNDVVLPSSGETAIDLASASCILKDGVAIGGDTTIIRSSQNGVFLAYCLNTACKKQIYSIAQGSSVIHLYANYLKTIKIPIPSLAEQEKIAEILSTWDTQIQNLESLIIEKQNLKKGLCQTLLTAKTRLKGFSGDWEVVRLGDVADFFSGGTPKTTERKYYGGEIPFIKSAEIYNSTTQEYLTQLGFKESSAKWVKKGDLLYALYGANSGEVAISKIDGVINQAILCIKNQPEVLNTYFLYSVFLEKKEWITTRFLQGGQGNLSGKIVQNLQIPLPPLAEQGKIAEILSEADNEITLLEQKLESLKSQKKGIIQILLNGKVKVK